MQSQDYCLQEYALQGQDLHPCLPRKDDSAPFSSNKIRAKSERILSAAITCTSFPNYRAAWGRF